MKINRAAIKADAKLAMKQAKPHPFSIALVYAVIIAILNWLGATVSGQTTMIKYLIYVAENGMESISAMPDIHISLGGNILTIAIDIMISMLGIGFTYYTLMVARRNKASFGELFEPFTNFFKLFILTVLIGVFVFLWSLLLIVPGIIAAYRYRMAVYILLDDPEKSPMECIRLSKEMTHGHKGELFVLDLSFIGWYILSAIPLVNCWVAPYVNTTEANFYDALKAQQVDGASYDGYHNDSDRGNDDNPPWEL